MTGAFCFASYVFQAEFLLEDVDLHMWQSCKMVFSFLSRWGLARVREECDQRLVRGLGVTPALRHRPRPGTDFTLVVGAEYSPQSCFGSVTRFCTVGTSLKAGLSPNFSGYCLVSSVFRYTQWLQLYGRNDQKSFPCLFQLSHICKFKGA